MGFEIRKWLSEIKFCFCQYYYSYLKYQFLLSFPFLPSLLLYKPRKRRAIKTHTYLEVAVRIHMYFCHNKYYEWDLEMRGKYLKYQLQIAHLRKSRFTLPFMSGQFSVSLGSSNLPVRTPVKVSGLLEACIQWLQVICSCLRTIKTNGRNLGSGVEQNRAAILVFPLTSYITVQKFFTTRGFIGFIVSSQNDVRIKSDKTCKAPYRILNIKT